MRLFALLRRGLGFDGPEPSAKRRATYSDPGPETGTHDWYTDFILHGDPNAPSPASAAFMRPLETSDYAELSPEASDRIWRSIVAEIGCRCRCHEEHDRQDAEAIA